MTGVYWYYINNRLFFLTTGHWAVEASFKFTISPVSCVFKLPDQVRFPILILLISFMYKWVLTNLMLGVTLLWIKHLIGGRGGRNAPSCLMLQKSEISASLIGFQARQTNADLTYLIKITCMYYILSVQ